MERSAAGGFPFFSQPSQGSQKQINGVAKEHLDDAGRAMVNGRNTAPVPQKFVFYATRLDGIEGGWVETHINEDGSGEWSTGGTAVGKLLYTLSQPVARPEFRRFSKEPAGRPNQALRQSSVTCNACFVYKLSEPPSPFPAGAVK